MVTEELLESMNVVYSKVDQKRAELLRALRGQPVECASGWYNGHYRRTESGDYQMDSFPIPVISVKDRCDIEINFDSYNGIGKAHSLRCPGLLL